MNDYQYRATGTIPGYPYGVTIVVDAANIEEAHDVAAEQLETVTFVSGPLHTEPKP